MRALILDDESAMAELIGLIMKDFGFEVFKAGNGEEGLSLLKQTGPVDVALVDLHMPVMNGLEFVKRVRADKAYDKMILMMVTTDTNFSYVEQVLELGANEYLMKPYTRDMVRSKLKHLKLLNT